MTDEYDLDLSINYKPVVSAEDLAARKGPDIALHGGEVGHVGADEQEDDQGEEQGHPLLGHGLAEDVDDGVERGVGEDVVEVGHVVDDRDERGECEERVDDPDCNHGLRNHLGCVPHLVRHVRGRVDAELGVDARLLADEDGEAGARPAARERELGPNLGRRRSRGVHPGRDDESQVHHDVQGEHDVLPHVHELRSVRVSDECDADGQQGEERRVPLRERVEVVMKRNQNLNERSDEKHAQRIARLPCKRRRPSGFIRSRNQAIYWNWKTYR